MKITKQDNFRVEVYPERLIFNSSYTDKELTDHDIDLCKEIVSGINRHVDNCESAEMICDTKEVCEYCGSTWEWEGDEEVFCCNEGLAEWKKQQAEKEEKSILREE